MLTPLERLPPLESHNSQDPVWRRPESPQTKHGRWRDSHLPAQEKLGPCANVTDAVSPHNPVLTLNSAADYPPPITMNGRSTGFPNKRSVTTTNWLQNLARAGFRYSP